MFHGMQWSYDSGCFAPPPFTTGLMSMNPAVICEVESLGESENLSCGVLVGNLILKYMSVAIGCHFCAHPCWLWQYRSSASSALNTCVSATSILICWSNFFCSSDSWSSLSIAPWYGSTVGMHVDFQAIHWAGVAGCRFPVISWIVECRWMMVKWGKVLQQES